jgi:hypothetical protein
VHVPLFVKDAFIIQFKLFRHRKETAALLGVDEEEARLYNATDDVDTINNKPAETITADAGLETPVVNKIVLAKPHKPNQNLCLWLFHLLEGITGVSAVCLLTTQLIPLLMVRASEIVVRIGALALALKVYVTIFCILILLVECDLPIPIVRDSPLFQAYLSRGFFYSFMGLICVQEAYSERVKDIVAHRRDAFHVGWAPIFMQISSWLMVAVGCLVSAA